MKPAPFILASASPRRAELLKELNLEFEVLPSNVPEVTDEFLTPFEICQLNAHRKARAVAKKHPDALVVGADTLVFLDHEIMGKPATKAEAQYMLEQLQGKTHQVVTGVTLMHLRTHQEKVFAVSTEVRFRELSPEDIRHYLDMVDPLDKAGAYAIQEHGEMLVEEISGSYSNVVGLPLEQLQAELRSWEGNATL